MKSKLLYRLFKNSVSPFGDQGTLGNPSTHFLQANGKFCLESCHAATSPEDIYQVSLRICEVSAQGGLQHCTMQPGLYSAPISLLLPVSVKNNSSE